VVFRRARARRTAISLQPESRPRFRQEVSLYAAMPVMAAIDGRRIIETLMKGWVATPDC
jgi:hypothetical protein